MYKYEKQKKNFESEPYLFDYSRVYDSNLLYSGNKRGRYFSHLKKEKKHLEKPNRDKIHRFIKIEEPYKPEYSEKSQSNKNIFSGFLRFIFACMVLCVFLFVFAVAISVFDKGDEAWNLKNYDDIIWPVVMQDPEPFNENTPLDTETMLKASLWELAMNHKSTNESQGDNDGQLTLSRDEVELTGKKLFGKELDFSGANRDKSDFYKFDSGKNVFLVEPISGTDGFLPHTVNARREGDDVVLKVGYVSPKNQFDKEMNRIIDNKVEKYAKYRLKKNANTGDFYILSVT